MPGIARNEDPENPAEGRREEMRQLSNPPQRRLSPPTWDDCDLEEAAGLSHVDVTNRFGIGAQTMANRFRRRQCPQRGQRETLDVG